MVFNVTDDILNTLLSYLNPVLDQVRHQFMQSNLTHFCFFIGQSKTSC